MKRMFAALIVMMSATAWAGDYEDGVVAYDRGDYATAVAKFEKAAARGDAEAQFALGYMYDEGKGVPRDYAQAVRWYELAAAQGLAEAQFALGQIYLNGLGVTQDSAAATTASTQRFASAGFQVLREL